MCVTAQTKTLRARIVSASFFSAQEINRQYGIRSSMVQANPDSRMRVQILDITRVNKNFYYDFQRIVKETD